MSAFVNCVNRADYFTDTGAPVKATLLKATGLENPYSGGGIANAKAIVIPANTVLLRFYKDTTSKLGPWWNTPRELKLLMEYAQRTGADFDEGRDGKDERGKGYLHAMNAVLYEWNTMAYVVAIKTLKPLVAYYGEGRAVQTKDRRLKPGRIWDKALNKQRRLRQIYLKNVNDYVPKAITVIKPDHNASVATDLEAIVKIHQSQKLLYE